MGGNLQSPSWLGLTVCLACVASPVLAQGTSDAAAPRLALVVGNSAYAAVPTLANPANDAALMAEKLWEAGFEVIETIDADREKMLADLATFRSRLRPGSEALFFYAGHGVQIGGRNYLLPVSVAPTSIDDLKAQSVDAQLIVDAMAASGSRLNLILLDACRNNPFTAIPAEAIDVIETRAVTLGQTSAEVTRGLEALSGASDGGLAEMTAGNTETMISFATAPGAVAFDGEGTNSPYTSALTEYIDIPGLEIGDLFRRVRGSVREATGGQQIAWTASTLESQFYFKPPLDDLRAATTGMGVESDTLGELPPRRVVDRTFWRAIRNTDRLDAFSAYVRTMPDGAFVADARDRIRALGGDPDSIVVSDTSLLGQSARGLLGPTPPAAGIMVDRAPTSVAIGVGTALLQANVGDGWVFVEDTPRLGVVTDPSGVALTRGSVQWLSSEIALGFTPKVGSNGGVDELKMVGLRDGGLIEPAGSRVEAYVDACDMLAGNPYDSQRVTGGTRQFIIDRNFDAAIAVCEIAVERYPEVVRFWAQLARAYRAAGRYDEALHWQEKAVDSGYVSALVYLGQMYLDAQAVPRDYARAKELFEAAAARDETAALTALAWIYRAGVGVDKDEARALEYYRDGATRGNDWAMTNIAEFYHQGIVVSRDAQEAVRWYTAAAKSGELTAQTRLARMYQIGDGIEPDYDQARFWYEAAAGRGVPNALTRLGVMYEDGQGTAKDIEAAARLYASAAGEGDPEAYYRLGRVHASDHPLFADPARAAELFSHAVAEGVSGADRDLARLYEQGRGVPRDLARARELFARAGQTNPWAARDAGRALASSEGMEPDLVEAARWYRIAADGGVPWAFYDLGRLTEDGRGVPADPIAALVLYATALGLGSDDALVNAVGGRLGRFEAQQFVAAAQKLLAGLGADVGPPDGKLGPATRAALDAAFARAGLAPTGQEITIDALAALSAMKLEP